MNDTAISQTDTLPFPGARALAAADCDLAACISTATAAVTAWRRAPDADARYALSRACAALVAYVANSPRPDHARLIWESFITTPRDEEIVRLLAGLDAAADAEAAVPGERVMVAVHADDPKEGIVLEVTWMPGATDGHLAVAARFAEARCGQFAGAVTRWWITDSSGTTVRDEFDAARRSGRPHATLTIEHEDRTLEYVLPAKFEVCGRCEGHGSHLTPSIGMHAYSAEEFAEEFADGEDRDAYFTRGGKYDVTCEICKGLRVVPAVTPAALSPRGKLAYARWCRDRREDRAYARMCAAERAMGA